MILLLMMTDGKSDGSLGRTHRNLEYFILERVLWMVTVSDSVLTSLPRQVVNRSRSQRTTLNTSFYPQIEANAIGTEIEIGKNQSTHQVVVKGYSHR